MLWAWFKTKKALAGVALAGVLAFAFMPGKAFEEVTQELIALFGLMMAGVLPTMVLTASVLRAGNLSVKKLVEYRDALRRQMAVWIGLFVIALFASLFVIVGKMVEWSIPVSLPLEWARLKNTSVDAIHALNAMIAMALALVALRAVAVGNGIISLLGLSAELAISEAQAREEARHREAELAINNIPERKGFGSFVDLPPH